MAVTRTITLDDLSPQEVAFAFCEMGAADQARFFATVWQIGRTWPGAGWCQQSSVIVEKLDTDGRNAISTLAAHLDQVPA